MLAVGVGGIAWGWGNNQAGELGDGTMTNRTVPVQIPARVLQVSTSGANTLAVVGSTFSAYAWASTSEAKSGRVAIHPPNQSRKRASPAPGLARGMHLYPAQPSSLRNFVARPA